MKSKTIVMFAVFATLLMFSGVYGLIDDYSPAHPSAMSEASHAHAMLPSIPETASAFVTAGYFTNGAVPDSGTTTSYLPFAVNSSYSNADFSFPSQLTISNGVATGSYQIGSYYYDPVSGTLDGIVTLNIILPLPVYSPIGGQYEADVGTVYLNLSTVAQTTGSGTSSQSQSYTFDYSSGILSNEPTGYISMTTTYVPSAHGDNGANFLAFTLSVAITSYQNSINTFGGLYVGNSASHTPYTASVSSDQVVVNPTSAPAQEAQAFAIGWHFNSLSGSFTIPQYESSFTLSWTSDVESNPVYNGQPQTSTSGSFSGSLTDNSYTVNPVGDPPTVVNGASTYTFNDYLSSQDQVSPHDHTTTSTPGYTYTQVAGTTNEASASFGMSGTTPTGTVFISYETAQNSLTTAKTNLQFTPSATVTNPYYNFAQNLLNGTISGASAGSYSGSNNENPTFSGGTATYTTSASPSWTVSLILFGNRHPVYVNASISLTTANPLTPITITANYSEYFNGETQYLQSSWNGKPLTSSASGTEEVSQVSHFNTPGSKTILYSASNSPNPQFEGSSALDSSTNSFTVSVVPFTLTPSPADYTVVGTSVLLSLAYSTQTAAKITLIDLMVNGVLVDRLQPDLASGTVKYQYTQPTLAPLLVTWTAEDQYGYSQNVTFQYGSYLVPSEYSNKITVLQAPNYTSSYPISLTGVPTGSGFYQQLLTISNPSQYGINTAGSNLQFSAGNGTLLYAWIQSINSTSMQVWIKNYYGNSVIDLQVLPSFENLFSANGYIGYGITYFNAYKVFEYATDFNNLTGWTITNTKYYLYNDTLSYLSAGGGSFTIPYDLNIGSELMFDAWFNGTPEAVGGNLVGIGSPYNVWAGTGYGGNGFGITEQNASGNTFASLTQPQGYASYALKINAASAQATLNGNTATVSTRNPSYPVQVGMFAQTGVSFNVSLRYLILVAPISSMPTFAIGTGSVFQANATTSSTFSGSPVGQYNATYSYMAYSVPIAPTTAYVTIIYNKTWIPANVYPSTYLPILPNTTFVTIEGVKGFSGIQITLIEPSQLIGSPTYQNIQYSMPGGLNPPTGYFLNDVSYVPFGSSTQYTIDTSSQFVQLPFGSTISLTVFDPWGDKVASLTNYLIANVSGQISTSPDVTELQFQFFNSTASYVYLSHNGKNLSFFNSAIVANDTTFSWATTYYSVTTGVQEIKAGTVSTDEPIQPLLIYLHAPAGQLQVSIDAYPGANLGTLSSSGNPRILAYIDGEPYTPGNTFSGFQGSTYEVRVADLLNQTLLETNITLQASFTSVTETLHPSYWMGIENDEEVPQDSPLATEYVSINRTGSPVHYNFTDSVGQNWIGYFAAGNYTVSMHDNVTNTFYVNISQSDQQFYLNGQQLLNLTEFNQKINELVNYTSSIQNTTYGLHVVTQSQVFSSQIGHTVYYQFGVYYNNYTAVSQSFLQNSTILVRITNSTATTVNIPSSESTSGNVYTLALTPEQGGDYSITVVVSHGEYGGIDTTTLTVSIPVIVQNGMRIELTGPGSLGIGEAGNYYIVLEYSNGSLFSTANTNSALANMTISVLLGNAVIQTITGAYYSAGILTFVFSSTTAGAYSLSASTHLDDGSNVSATYILPVSVQGITSNIGVIALDTPSEAQVNQLIPFELEFQTASGSLLTANQINALVANSTISIRNSESLTYTTAVSGHILYVNFSSASAGYYTFSLASYFAENGNTYSVVFSASIAISVPPIADNGMSLFITGSSSIQSDTRNAYFITLFYRNGTSFDGADTASANTNLSLQLFAQSGIFIADLTHSVYSNGIIEAYVNVSAGSYFILASTHLDDPTYVSASNVLDFTSVSGASLQKITIIGVDTPSTFISGQSGTYIYRFMYPNGTVLDNAELRGILPYLNVTLLNSESIQPTLAVVGNELDVNFTFTGYGYYTLTIYGQYTSGLITYAIYLSQQISVNQLARNISISLSGPSKIEFNVSTVFVLSVLQNGSALNKSDTLAFMNNTSASIYLSGNFAGLATLHYIQPGKIGIAVNLSTLSNAYILSVDAQNVNISGHYFYGEVQASFSVVPYNPANPPTTQDGIISFLTSEPMLIFYFAATALGLIAYFWPEIPWVKRRREKEASLDAAGNTIEGMVALKVADNQPLTPAETAMWNAIPNDLKNELIKRLTSGRIRKFSKEKVNKSEKKHRFL